MAIQNRLIRIPNDFDGDGIINAEDHCPWDKEVPNGIDDEDGCPDDVPEPVQLFTGIINGIHFELNSADIRPTSTEVLNAAVAVFKEYKALRIEVSGHTDPNGTEESNSSLSRRRADAVKWYLVDHGIDPHRIATVGYGARKPIVASTPSLNSRALVAKQAPSSTTETRSKEFTLQPRVVLGVAIGLSS